MPSTNNSSSEILEIKEVGSIDEVRNFRTDGGVPYMMEHPFQAVVRFEPMSYSYSQHTTSTTISRDNSIKLRKENGSENNITFNSIAKKLRNCTKKTPKVVKGNERNGARNNQQQVVEVVCAGGNPPFLRETDEEIIDSSHVLADGDDYDVRNFYQTTPSS